MDEGVEPASYCYRHSGLSIASALELPEWEAFGAPCEAAPDVRIEIADGPPSEFPTESVVVEGDRLRFAVEGVGGWEISDGETIRLFPGPAAGPRELRLFTLGSAWGALGYQRGFPMWHGSAVARDGRAILLCGDTGQGKSTTAAALLARGAALVADDLSRVERRGDVALIYPSSTRVKLWGAALDRFGWRNRVIERDHFREDKFHCSVPRTVDRSRPLPLAGVVVLEWGEAIALERLRGSEALTKAMAATLYRPEMLEALGAWPQQAALAARIVEASPVWRLSRPRDLARLDEACAEIEALWARPVPNAAASAR